MRVVCSYSLVLDSGYVLELNNVFYIPKFKRNLISVSRCINVGISFTSSRDLILSLLNNSAISFGSIKDCLYYLSLRVSKNAYVNSPAHTFVTSFKCIILAENSALLWHRRLGHISVKRVGHLVKNKILPILDFSDLNVCIDCTKGKLTKQIKLTASRLLDCSIWCTLIYTVHSRLNLEVVRDTSSHLLMTTLSILMCIYLNINLKLLKSLRSIGSRLTNNLIERLRCCILITAVSIIERRIMMVFTSFLKREGIVAHITTPGTHEQNSIAEKRT